MSSKTINYLDYIRIKFGAEKLKEFVKSDRENAAELLNDRNLTFCTLFILMPEIDSLNLYRCLNPRNISALKLCAKILKNDFTNIESLTPGSEEETLKWMLGTGFYDDGLNDRYDTVMDGAASLLVNLYNDKTSLPIIAHLIFARNRKKRYIHDLVWVLFQSKDLYVLELISNYLRSKHTEDIALANELLNPSDDEENPVLNRKNLYKSSVGWIKENMPYINFTDENFLQTSHPKHCTVDLEAKYLGKKGETYDDDDFRCLECLNSIEIGDREILSEYSHRLRKANPDEWKKWLSLPVERQFEIARGRLRI